MYKLIIILFEVTKDFPKEYKYTLGHDIKRDGINLVRSIYRANKAKNKVEYLEAFLDDFELIKLEIAGQIKITGGNPGAGKLLVSDTSGLGSWVSFDKVAFHAGTLPNSPAQTICGSTNFTATTVSYGQGNNWFNAGGAYNSNPPYAFTPPVTGVYQLNCHISYSNATSYSPLSLMITAPSGIVAKAVDMAVTNGNGSIQLSTIVNSAVTPGPYNVKVLYQTSLWNSLSIAPYDSHFSGCLLYKN